MNNTNKDTKHMWCTIVIPEKGDVPHRSFDSREKAIIYLAQELGHLSKEDIGNLSLEELNLIIEDKLGKRKVVELEDNDFTLKWVDSNDNICKITKYFLDSNGYVYPIQNK